MRNQYRKAEQGKMQFRDSAKTRYKDIRNFGKNATIKSIQMSI